MRRYFSTRRVTGSGTVLLTLALGPFAVSLHAADNKILFNVRDYGATGRKADEARAAIQKAIDACAAAGGGTVYMPAGEYTSGELRLRSHVRVYLDSGAILNASKDPEAYNKGALFYGQDVVNITLEGRGTIHGQAEYEWRLDDLDDAYIRPNKLMMLALGKPLLRSFPKGFPQRKAYPRMVLLVRGKDVRIAGLTFRESPSWTINPYACEHLVIDGVHIYSSQKEAVWADGIDPDGCKDVHIANSTIETGDDAIVFYSGDSWGPALPCENITVTNCRLSSASSALKFCDGNKVAIRNVTVDNTVITNSNRGIAFMVFDGGEVSDVVLSNLTIETHRFDWFWWGDGDPIHFNIKRRSEVDGVHRENEPPAGKIRHVLIQNVIARGKGSSTMNGHPDSWLDDVRMENVKLYLSTDPAAPYDKSVHAMQIRWARNLELKDFEVNWEHPELNQWGSALYLEDVEGLEIDGFSGRPAKKGSESPAVVFNQVEDATIRGSRATPGTKVFLGVMGSRSRRLVLFGNDLREAEIPYRLHNDVKEQIRALSNFGPKQE